MFCRLGVVVLLLVLTACGPNVKKDSTADARIDGLPISSPEHVSRIYVVSFKHFPSNVLFVWWKTRLMTLDYKPIPNNASIIQTSPGKHTLDIAFTIESDPNSNADPIKGTCKMEFDLEEGKLYYITKINRSSGGRCSASIGENNPAHS